MRFDYNEDNSSLTLFSELEKSITKEALVQKQTTPNGETKAKQEKLKKRELKVPFARKKGSHKDPNQKRNSFIS